jgi:transketolase
LIIHIRLYKGWKKCSSECLRNEDFKFELAKANVLLEGDDLTIIGTGETFFHCMEAGKKLHEQGIKARVIDYAQFKAFDKEIVENSSSRNRKNYNS